MVHSQGASQPAALLRSQIRGATMLRRHFLDLREPVQPSLDMTARHEKTTYCDSSEVLNRTREPPRW
jgi:hypothetical protein